MENPGRYLPHTGYINGKKGRNKKTLIGLSSVVLSPPFSSPLTNVLGYSRRGVVENILWDHVCGTKHSGAIHGTARKWQLTWSSLQVYRYGTMYSLGKEIFG